MYTLPFFSGQELQHLRSKRIRGALEAARSTYISKSYKNAWCVQLHTGEHEKVMYSLVLTEIGETFCVVTSRWKMRQGRR